jgi:hypothetical protein
MDGAEFAARRHANGNGTCSSEPTDVDAVVFQGRSPFVNERAVGGRHSGTFIHVFDAEGNARERTDVFTLGNRAVDSIGILQSLLVANMHEGV